MEFTPTKDKMKNTTLAVKAISLACILTSDSTNGTHYYNKLFQFKFSSPGNLNAYTHFHVIISISILFKLTTRRN